MLLDSLILFVHKGHLIMTKTDIKTCTGREADKPIHRQAKTQRNSEAERYLSARNGLFGFLL